MAPEPEQRPRPPGGAIERFVAAGSSPAAMDWDEMYRRAQVLAKSELVPVALRDKPESIVLVGALGAELGVPFITALSDIHVIEGRAAPSAQLRLALVRRYGHDYRWLETTEDRAVVEGRRHGETHWTRVEWTRAMAERAGLLDQWVTWWEKDNNGRGRWRPKGKFVLGSAEHVPDWAQKAIREGKVQRRENWYRYPADMLRARAASTLCRMVFSDVMFSLGLAATTAEESGLDVDHDVEPAHDDGAAPAPGPPAEDDVVDAELVGDDDYDDPGPVYDVAEPEPDVGKGGDQEIKDPEPGTPVGEDDDVDHEPPPAPADEAAERPLAQQIAMQASAAGLDRAAVISACTAGAKASARAVTPAEGSAVLQAIAAIRDGRLVLEEHDDGWRLSEPSAQSAAPTPAAAPPAPGAGGSRGPVDAGQWDADAWRKVLADRRIKAAAFIAAARAEARRLSVTNPDSLDDVVASPALARAMGEWLRREGGEE